MKVLLIGLEISPSISLPLLQEILIQKGMECDYIHLPIEANISDSKLEEILLQIKEMTNGVELIGISLMTNTFNMFKRLSIGMKNWDIPIVAGGIHPTFEPEECLDYVDYVCTGEAEKSLLDLSERISTKDRTDNIPGIYVKQNGTIIKNKIYGFTEDLNLLPVPKINLEKRFFLYDGKIKQLNENLMNEYHKKYYYILGSRGCPYRCRYCLNDSLISVNHKFSKIRKRSTEHIIQELKNAKKLLPKDIIIGFIDDDFCVKSMKELEDFCSIYKKEIGLPFFCAATPTSINDKKIKALISAGLIRLEIGIQSISDSVNHNIFGRFALKKNSTDATKMLEKYRNKVQLCYDFILDNPWEKDDTKIETLNFIMSLKKPITISIFSLTIYPGTKLFDRAKKENIIKDVQIEVYNKNFMILQNDAINTLFVLYTRYYFPKFIIKILIRYIQVPLIKITLKHMTFFLWRSNNYFTGLYDSIKRKDKTSISYYLSAPIKILRGKK